MAPYAVALNFNNAPFLFLGRFLCVLILLAVVIRVIEWFTGRQERESRRERAEAFADTKLDAVPRLEALKLIEKLGAVRGRMLALDHALTQRKEGVRWTFGIGDNADKFSRNADADSDVDQFLSERTKRDLENAQGEMISLFRDAAKWLEKYAPEELPPPPMRERIANAALTFLGRFFPALKRDADRKMIPVVRKAQEKHLPDRNELPEKVANGETANDAAAGSGESPKSREKLRIPLDLLDAGKPGNLPDAASLRQSARLLRDALRDFKIDVVPVGAPVAGPSVTRYEFRFQGGVTLKKLSNRADDIALTLGVNAVSIAPVTGKNGVVGVEVPNAKPSAVPLRDVLESRDFLYGPLTTFALGRGIDGAVIMGDLAELPHVLIAGTTGSGKSVCLNALIVSLLYKAAPEEMRFIMIDPKRVELAPYNGIKSLELPVVTDPAQAVSALQGAAVEMDTRYKAFEGCGVKELADYNRKAKTPVPRLVVVIDELSDLMMTAGKAVEESIVRIAQMGRAAGIHLVIATQRPSSNVITGLMKANIPSRVAFAVASAMESRIILDESGAENLCGKGDMIFKPFDGKARRLQGAFISNEEIERIVEETKRH